MCKGFIKIPQASFHWGSVEVVGGTEFSGVVHTKGYAQRGESSLGLKALK